MSIITKEQAIENIKELNLIRTNKHDTIVELNKQIRVLKDQLHVIDYKLKINNKLLN